MSTPVWVTNEVEWLERQVMKMSCSIELLEHANADLQHAVRYWREKAEASMYDNIKSEGDSGDSPTLPPP